MTKYKPAMSHTLWLACFASSLGLLEGESFEARSHVTSVFSAEEEADFVSMMHTRATVEQKVDMRVSEPKIHVGISFLNYGTYPYTVKVTTKDRKVFSQRFDKEQMLAAAQGEVEEHQDFFKRLVGGGQKLVERETKWVLESEAHKKTFLEKLDFGSDEKNKLIRANPTENIIQISKAANHDSDRHQIVLKTVHGGRVTILGVYSLTPDQLKKVAENLGQTEDDLVGPYLEDDGNIVKFVTACNQRRITASSGGSRVIPGEKMLKEVTDALKFQHQTFKAGDFIFYNKKNRGVGKVISTQANQVVVQFAPQEGLEHNGLSEYELAHAQMDFSPVSEEEIEFARKVITGIESADFHEKDVPTVRHMYMTLGQVASAKNDVERASAVVALTRFLLKRPGHAAAWFLAAERTAQGSKPSSSEHSKTGFFGRIWNFVLLQEHKNLEANVDLKHSFFDALKQAFDARTDVKSNESRRMRAQNVMISALDRQKDLIEKVSSGAVDPDTAFEHLKAELDVQQWQLIREWADAAERDARNAAIGFAEAILGAIEKANGGDAQEKLESFFDPSEVVGDAAVDVVPALYGLVAEGAADIDFTTLVRGPLVHGLALASIRVILKPEMKDYKAALEHAVFRKQKVGDVVQQKIAESMKKVPITNAAKFQSTVACLNPHAAQVLTSEAFACSKFSAQGDYVPPCAMNEHASEDEASADEASAEEASADEQATQLANVRGELMLNVGADSLEDYDAATRNAMHFALELGLNGVTAKEMVNVMKGLDGKGARNQLWTALSQLKDKRPEMAIKECWNVLKRHNFDAAAAIASLPAAPAETPEKQSASTGTAPVMF